MKRTFAWIGLAAAAALLLPPVWAQRGQGRGGSPPGAVAPRGVSDHPGRRDPVAFPTDRGPHSKPPSGLHPESASMARLENNAALSARLQPLLPAGTTLKSAAGGFKNEGQFAATLHVSRNLNIPFDQLKAEMTRGEGGSLGNAIRALRPDLDGQAVKDNVKLAERQARDDLRVSRDRSGENRKPADLSGNSALAGRLQPMLPPGMTLDEAAAGFKNQGQFIAALHVSKNLDLPFIQLKERITAGESLGEAIRAVKPDLSPEAVRTTVRTAEEQSRADLAARGKE